LSSYFHYKDFPFTASALKIYRFIPDPIFLLFPLIKFSRQRRDQPELDHRQGSNRTTLSEFVFQTMGVSVSGAVDG